jgi:hypothetical protein
MKWTVLAMVLVATTLLSACAPQGLRCDSPLEPINANTTQPTTDHGSGAHAR